MHHRLTRRHCATLGVGALLLAALGVPPSSADGQAPNVIRVEGGYVTRLGPWNAKRDSSLGRAVHVFGAPSSVRYDGPGECRADWSGRHVSATFHYRDENQRFRTHCGRIGRLDWFIAGSTSWRTDRGLRVGAPTSRVRLVYPAPSLTRKGLWELTTEPELDGVTTEAEPRGGHVRSLRAWFIED